MWKQMEIQLKKIKKIEEKNKKIIIFNENNYLIMNIFLLSLCIKKCAKYHCDKHVVKMILETTQLLYTAHWVLNSKESIRNSKNTYEDERPLPAYKPFGKNHPCSIWVRQCQCNYKWLVKLGLELCKEYRKRYSKTHKCEKHLEWLKLNIPNYTNICEKEEITILPQAMPDEYKTKNPKNNEDVVEAYRRYYINEKYNFAVWYKKRELRPKWFKKRFSI